MFSGKTLIWLLQTEFLKVTDCRMGEGKEKLSDYMLGPKNKKIIKKEASKPEEFPLTKKETISAINKYRS